MKIPIHFVIGDTDGHDKMVGKYTYRVNVPYICRYCDFHIKYIDNVYTKFKLTLDSTITRLSSSRKYEILKSMSYHCIDNAFTGLTYSDPHLGIIGCVLAEVLHIMQHGLFLYAGAGLFGTKGELQKKGTKRKKSPNVAKKSRHSERQ